MLAGQAVRASTTRSRGSTGWLARYGDQEVSQFRGAEMIAEKWDITRDDMEEFAVESHERAIRARAEGRFEREIVPLGGVHRRRGPARAQLGQDPLAADALPDGRLDRRGVEPDLRRRRGAPDRRPSRRVQDHGLTPRARIHHLSVRGADPI